MDIGTLRDLLGVLLFAALCIPALAFVILLIYSTVIKLGQLSAHIQLARSIGFSALHRGSSPSQTWYGALYKGRSVAMRAFSSTYRYYALERSRTGFKVKLRIATAVHVEQLLGITIVPKRKHKSAQSFEEAFELKGGSLHPAAREAMLGFAFLGHRKGWHKDLNYSIERGVRQLQLADRSAVPKDVLPEEVLPDAVAVLIHDHPFVDLSPAELEAVIEELGAVAEAIETERVPPLLEGKSAPVPDPAGKYAYWAFLAFVIAGVPACVCGCGMLFSFLGGYQ